MSLSSCPLVLLMANIAVRMACTSFVCFILTSRDPSDTAAETLHGNAAELTAPVVVFIPDIGESRMTVAFGVHERIPFFGIVGYDKEVVQFSEFRIFVRNGVNFALVLFFDCFHLFMKFRLLVDPEAAKSFKEANLVAFAEAFYLRFVDVHFLHDFDSLFFLCDVLVCHFRILLKCNFVKFRSCSRCSGASLRSRTTPAGSD